MSEKRVWKFELNPWDCEVLAPAYSEALSVGTQGKQLFVWMLCDPHALMTTHRFLVRGTGHDVPGQPGRFVGTAQMQTPDNVLVWHVWQRP